MDSDWEEAEAFAVGRAPRWERELVTRQLAQTLQQAADRRREEVQELRDAAWRVVLRGLRATAEQARAQRKAEARAPGQVPNHVLPRVLTRARSHEDLSMRGSSATLHALPRSRSLRSLVVGELELPAHWLEHRVLWVEPAPVDPGEALRAARAPKPRAHRDALKRQRKLMVRPRADPASPRSPKSPHKDDREQFQVLATTLRDVEDTPAGLCQWAKALREKTELVRQAGAAQHASAVLGQRLLQVVERKALLLGSLALCLGAIEREEQHFPSKFQELAQLDLAARRKRLERPQPGPCRRAPVVQCIHRQPWGRPEKSLALLSDFGWFSRRFGVPNRHGLVVSCKRALTRGLTEWLARAADLGEELWAPHRHQVAAPPSSWIGGQHVRPASAPRVGGRTFAPAAPQPRPLTPRAPRTKAGRPAWMDESLLPDDVAKTLGPESADYCWAAADALERVLMHAEQLGVASSSRAWPQFDKPQRTEQNLRALSALAVAEDARHVFDGWFAEHAAFTAKHPEEDGPPLLNTAEAYLFVRKAQSRRELAAAQVRAVERQLAQCVERGVRQKHQYLLRAREQLKDLRAQQVALLAHDQYRLAGPGKEQEALAQIASARDACVALGVERDRRGLSEATRIWNVLRRQQKLSQRRQAVLTRRELGAAGAGHGGLHGQELAKAAAAARIRLAHADDAGHGGDAPVVRAQTAPAPRAPPA